MEFLAQELIRAVPSVRKSVFPLHRPPQLGAGNQRFREGGWFKFVTLLSKLLYSLPFCKSLEHVVPLLRML